MHLSLLREYLDLEFSSLKEGLPFPYDLEKIIDDFVLMAFFVGNDFLPNLPHLHIAEGALSLMFNVYKKAIIQAGGYINDGGRMNIERLQILLNFLHDFEKDLFEEQFSDLNWYSGKTISLEQEKLKKKEKGGLFITAKQKELYEEIKKFYVVHNQESLHFSPDLSAKDRGFIQTVAKDLGLLYAVEFHDDVKTRHAYVEFDTEDEEETDDSVSPALKKYDAAIVSDDSVNQLEVEEKARFEEKYREWKSYYYREKFEFDLDDQESMDKLVKSYVEGLQWVLNYYYNGICSWGWFFPFHYAPMISDLKDLTRFEIKFDMGSPFRPYEQLMGVLPEASRSHIPMAYRELMLDPNSPIIDFYPTDFALDMNGKKADWEAVVKIPFIDQDRLLKAMKTREHRLTAEEVQRNAFGENVIFTYDKDLDEFYPSSLPGTFPDINRCQCKVSVYNLPTVDDESMLNKGLCKGVGLGVKAMAGFPTLHTIPHTGALALHGINVFQFDSKNETMVITLQDIYEHQSADAIANMYLNKRVFVSWPFLVEAKLSYLTDEFFKYQLVVHNGKLSMIKTPHEPEDAKAWYKKTERLERKFSKRRGVLFGSIKMIAHVLLLKGLCRSEDGALVKEYANPGEEKEFPLQTMVDKVELEDPRFLERPPISISEEFPVGTPVFFLGKLYYGSPAVIFENSPTSVSIKMNTSTVSGGKEPVFGQLVTFNYFKNINYTPSFVISKKLGVSNLILSRLTSSMRVIAGEQKYNLGLNLKFEAKQQKVLGYSRKTTRGWEFTQKAIAMLQEYKAKFPEFIQGLEQRKNADLYYATDFYPSEVASQKMEEIKEWIKSLGCDDLERVPLDAEALDKESITLIESHADQYVQSNSDIKSILIKNIPRKAVLKPADAIHGLDDQKFNLGDRVTYVLDSGKVAMATKGTVVGLLGTTADVVFDHTFISGNDLGGRCSAHRGMSVPFHSILNLNRPQIGDVAKLQPERQSHDAPQHQNRNYNNNNQYRHNNAGPNPNRNLTPYPSEFLPQRGRGRGDHSSRARPQGTHNSYHHAPPPPQYDQDRGNDHDNRQPYRGRGGYHPRGRGGQGRVWNPNKPTQNEPSQNNHY
ncbi:exonuclease II Exo2 [Basidiobolus ranarum]|uniref:Exonuclease II Exo2 n=1 Tax=Basidiobolus ranarum TaxID=34480 RepID=A0ABR2X104_9FUNG